MIIIYNTYCIVTPLPQVREGLDQWFSLVRFSRYFFRKLFKSKLCRKFSQLNGVIFSCREFLFPTIRYGFVSLFKTMQLPIIADNHFFWTLVDSLCRLQSYHISVF